WGAEYRLLSPARVRAIARIELGRVTNPLHGPQAHMKERPRPVATSRARSRPRTRRGLPNTGTNPVKAGGTRARCPRRLPAATWATQVLRHGRGVSGAAACGGRAGVRAVRGYARRSA